MLLALAGCHDKSSAPAVAMPTADQDALWKLAPDGAIFGMVASSRALQMSEHAWSDVRAFMGATPELAPVLVQIGAALGAPDLAPASFGLTTTKGAALFFIGPGKAVAIVPVADRDTFMTAVHGTRGPTTDWIDKNTACTITRGVYACASDPSLFDRLGKGELSASAAGARGDIEVVAHDLPIDGRPTSFAAVAQLVRGGFMLRGTVSGLPTKVMVGLGGASTPRIDSERTTGFALAHLRGLIATLPIDGDDHLAFDVRESDVLNSISDPLTVTTQASTFDVQLPLTNPVPLKTLLVDHCADGVAKNLSPTLIDGSCHITVPNIPALAIDVWLDGSTLHVGQKAATSGPAVPPTSFAKELASQPWQDVLYGRGSVLAAGDLLSQQMIGLQNMPPEMAGIAHIAARVMAFINEAGVAVRVDGDQLRFVLGLRTAWSNPDDVVTKLLALDPDAILAGRSLQLVTPIVDAAPDSPLAADVRAGYGGLAMHSGLVGALAAVAIPVFTEYMRPVKPSDEPPTGTLP